MVTVGMLHNFNDLLHRWHFKSPGQICDDMGVEYKNGANGGANLIKAEAAFQKYGFTTQMGGVMTESQIVKVIDSDLPVFTQWFSDKPDRDGHSMVLAGYRYSSSGFGMTLMDPNRGFIASRYRGKKSKITYRENGETKVFKWEGSLIVQ